MDYRRDNGGGILAAGRKLLIENAELAAKMTRAAAKALGLEAVCRERTGSGADRHHGLGRRFDSEEIVKRFRDQFGAVVANGQAEMKGKIFRIAHLGYYDYLDTIGILAALEQVLAGVTGKTIEYGAAVRAAQEVYARDRADKRVHA